MTREEEIKQNAEKYLANLNRSGILLTGNEVYNAFIAGAHSRDEEIFKLQENVEAMQSYIEAEKDCMQDDATE